MGESAQEDTFPLPKTVKDEALVPALLNRVSYLMLCVRDKAQDTPKMLRQCCALRNPV